MRLDVFDVEHGACSLLTCDDFSRIMIDCGHNASTGWKPGDFLADHEIDELDLLIVSNYDEDHVSGIENLFDRVDVSWLLRNGSVDTKILRTLKSESGMGPGIEKLCDLIDNTFTGGASGPKPAYQGLKRNIFRNIYPTFEDENNLSLVSYLECNLVGVLFTGDLEKEGWIQLLKEQDFKNALRDTNILIAPHHGRENGCCEEAMSLCTSLFYVVISDQGYQYDTQKTIPFYSRFARGGPFRGQERRKILTTRKDGPISFNFGSNTWGPE